MAFICKTRPPDYFYKADDETKALAKHLRKSMTAAENVLWENLRANRLMGLKFRRQHPILSFIADFYCHKARLVIEADGPIHLSKDQKEYDEHRNAEMERHGILVLRFKNEEILNDLPGVLKIIEETIKQRLSSLIPPPPLQGEGVGGRGQ